MILAAGSTQPVLQVIEQGVTTGAIYALIAIGYTLVYGIIQLINFAHGDVFMWGTLVTFFLLKAFNLSSAVINPFQLIGLVLLMMLIAMAACAVIALTVERVAYRPLRKAPRIAPLISAIGASFILENLGLFAIGPSSLNVPNLFPTGSWSLFGLVSFPYLDVFIIVLAIILMYALSTFISRTKIGRAMRSVSQDSEAASLMGVNINQVIIITFLLGGALAGAASVVYAMRLQVAFFLTGFEAGLKAFTAAVLGGIGNLYGAMLGGLFIGLGEAFVTAYIPDGLKWADATVFAVLVLVLVFRPSGFLGMSAIVKV
jgi:branched-chain amino acid transport system permease protein